MKASTILIYAPIALCFMLFSACVPQKKFTAMEERANRLGRDSVKFYNEILGYKGAISKLELEQDLIQNKLDKSKVALNTSQETIQAQQARLAELQKRIDEQKQASENLKNTIANALTAFNADQLTVSLKNGKVYVSMSEKLLFASGSADVGTDGKTALATLAKALNENPDININIEGHTDSIPIAKKYADNWALSVARSTAITRILINEYQVNPIRIISSGRSEYLPIATNESEEGRSKNRRTEIILEPKLDKIMELLDHNNQ
jgi:chemotaxis protein MotB